MRPGSTARGVLMCRDEITAVNAESVAGLDLHAVLERISCSASPVQLTVLRSACMDKGVDDAGKWSVKAGNATNHDHVKTQIIVNLSKPIGIELKDCDGTGGGVSVAEVKESTEAVGHVL